jgi:hypothetical protein
MGFGACGPKSSLFPKKNPALRAGFFFGIKARFVGFSDTRV